MYLLKGGAVPVPRWSLILRLIQLIFAILIMSLTAFSLSVGGGGPIQPPLIATIIISILTIFPILMLTTPLLVFQRELYEPRIALVSEGIATLFWLAAFAALASYVRLFRDYGRVPDTIFPTGIDFCVRCRRAWKCAAAAAVFSVFEFALFLFTTLTFIYYYHCELAGIQAPGIRPRNRYVAEAGTGDIGAETGVATGGSGNNENGPASSGANESGNHRHEMSAIPQTQTLGQNGATHASDRGPPYPTSGESSPHPLPHHPAGDQREGDYDGYENMSRGEHGHVRST